MDNLLLLQKRFQYGSLRFFPMNQLAKDFAKLLYRKTLSDENLKGLESMGFVVEWIPEGSTLADWEASHDKT